MAKKKKTKKSTYKPSYVTVAKPGAAPTYTNTAKVPAEYQSTAVAPEAYQPTAVAPEAFQAGTYESKYADQLNSSLNTITNWKYDPLQDASYQALAKVYGARGNQAAKNSLADAAALNGGYGTSYAVSAAQQARNQYNQELAALIPDLEQNAFNKAQVTYNALRDAEDTDYTRFRDTEGDRQWKYQQDYQKYRDTEADNQWKYTQAYNAYRDTEADNQWKWSQNYNAYRDQVADQQWLYGQNYQKYQDALSQYQWALDYNNAVYASKKKSSVGGGRRSGGGGGGGYSSAGGSSSGTDLASVFNKAKASTKSSGTAYGPYLNFGQRIANASKKVGKAAKKATKKK